jgi:hypothetical protein
MATHDAGPYAAADLACLLAASTLQQSTKSRKWHFPFTAATRV